MISHGNIQHSLLQYIGVYSLRFTECLIHITVNTVVNETETAADPTVSSGFEDQRSELICFFQPPKALPTKEGIPTMLAYLPLYHSYGLQVYIFRGLFAPITMLSLPRWDIETALKVIPELVFNHCHVEMS
jgi:hypothetical protein